MIKHMNQEQLINDLVIEVTYLVKKINSLDLLINNADSEDKEKYVFEILDTIDEYKEMNKKLTAALETQFEYEKENNLPRNFNYVRLHKKLEES